MPSNVLTVTLNPAIDKIIEVKNLSLGCDFRAERIRLSAGGKGLNVSRALKCLGLKSMATGFLGGLNGELVHRQLNEEDLRNHFQLISDETRTNLTILDPAKKKITRVLERGPQITPGELKTFKAGFSRFLSSSRFAVFSGSAAPGLPDSIYRDLIILAKRKNVKTFLDTSGLPLRKGIEARPFFIKPNLEEAEMFLGRRLNSKSAIKKTVNHFHRLGVEVVVISMGEKGGVASNGKIILAATPPPLKCVNDVGSGDVLTAGFVWAFANKMNFEQAVAFAFGAASASVLSTVPGHVSKTLIKKAKPAIRRL